MNRKLKKLVLPHFKSIIFDMDVDWDDDGEGLDSNYSMVYFAKDLLNANVLTIDENDNFIIDIYALDEYLSDDISNRTGFCHNGFTYDIRYEI